MPATRSSKSSATLISSTFVTVKTKVGAAKQAAKKVVAPPPPAQPERPLPTFTLNAAPDLITAADIHFDFETARAHLIAADGRFGRVFDELRCTPFETPVSVDPFRSLVTSIVGQQVSWLAARAINHRFRRLFDPSLPEKADESTDNGDLSASFPTPADVLKLSVDQLKTAGLSTRKGEYVRSLAEHFMDGRLSSKFLAEGSVEDVSKALIDVRGIGQWTVDMFLIFTLHRADILPVGDLGVQKGLLKWVLSAHQNDKCPSPSILTPLEGSLSLSSSVPSPPTDISSIIPAPAEAAPVVTSKTNKKTISKENEEARLKKALEASYHLCPEGFDPDVSYPLIGEDAEGEKMSVTNLKSRHTGKKLKGGAYLSPKEMEQLTAKWVPYRSLGSYFMWRVAEETA